MGEELLVVSKFKGMGETKTVHRFKKPWIISFIVVGIIAYIFSNSVPSDRFSIFELF